MREDWSNERMREEVGKCAYLVPTYNRHDILKSMLNEVLEIFKAYGIDIYVYDSSESDETQKNVEAMMAAGYDNLYYIRIDSGVLPDEKALLLYNGYGLKKKYKWIWPTKDRSYVKEAELRELVNSMEMDYSALIIGPDEKVAAEEYTDMPLCYYAWGGRTTSLNVTIFNYEALLSMFDEEKIKARYYFNNECSFLHYTLLWHGVAQLENPKVKVVYVGHKDVEGASSTWYKDAFRVWADLWLRVNNALPDIYKPYREAVIRQVTSAGWILGSNDQLMFYKEMGVLTPGVVEAVRDVWDKLSYVTLEELALIADGRYDLLKELILCRLGEYEKQGRYEEAQGLRGRNRILLESDLEVKSEEMSEADYKSLVNSLEVLSTRGYEFLFCDICLEEIDRFLGLLYAYKQKSGKKIFAFTVSDEGTEVLTQCPYIDEVMQIDGATFYMLMQDSEFIKQFKPINTVLM